MFWRGYPLLVTFVIVVTANHFLLDAVLGALTAGLAAARPRWLARAAGLGLRGRAESRPRQTGRLFPRPAAAPRRPRPAPTARASRGERRERCATR